MSLARQLFREMRPMFRMLDEPFTRPSTYAGFQSPLPAMPNFDALTASPAVDVSEEGDKYTINADLPGIPKDNIELRIGENGRNVTIEGKVVEEVKAEKASVDTESSKTDSKVVIKSEGTSNALALSSERPFTRNVSFSRTIWLPRPVDAKQVTAKLDHGVLRIVLNKMHDKASTVVPID